MLHNNINDWDNPYDNHNGLSIIFDGGPTIPLHLSDTKIQFHTRSPINNELENCPHTKMKSNSEWEPTQFKSGELNRQTNTPQYS